MRSKCRFVIVFIAFLFLMCFGVSTFSFNKSGYAYAQEYPVWESVPLYPYSMLPGKINPDSSYTLIDTAAFSQPVPFERGYYRLTQLLAFNNNIFFDYFITSDRSIITVSDLTPSGQTRWQRVIEFYIFEDCSLSLQFSNALIPSGYVLLSQFCVLERSIHYDNAYDIAYQGGINDGYNSGYAIGYDTGYDSAYNTYLSTFNFSPYLKFMYDETGKGGGIYTGIMNFDEEDLLPILSPYRAVHDGVTHYYAFTVQTRYFPSSDFGVARYFAVPTRLRLPNLNYDAVLVQVAIGGKTFYEDKPYYRYFYKYVVPANVALTSKYYICVGNDYGDLSTVLSGPYSACMVMASYVLVDSDNNFLSLDIPSGFTSSYIPNNRDAFDNLDTTWILRGTTVNSYQYNSGYNAGYERGINDNSLRNFIPNILSALGTFFDSLGSFEIAGITLGNVVMFIILIGILAWIINSFIK